MDLYKAVGKLDSEARRIVVQEMPVPESEDDLDEDDLDDSDDPDDLDDSDDDLDDPEDSFDSLPVG